jgi:hypothetical protein
MCYGIRRRNYIIKDDIDSNLNSYLNNNINNIILSLSPSITMTHVSIYNILYYVYNIHMRCERLLFCQQRKT